MTKRTCFHCQSTIRQQRGAALVVALILLLVLTILGVTAMNTTTLEERMAANSQERSRAMQAADSGVSQAYSVLDTTTKTAPLEGASQRLSTGGIKNAGACFVSRYLATLNPPARPGLEGYGVTKFQAYYFDVQSEGYNLVKAGGDCTNTNTIRDDANTATVVVNGGAYQIVPLSTVESG